MAGYLAGKRGFLGGCHRRDYKAEHKMASIVLLYDLGATQGNDAKARGISGTQ